MGWCKDVVQWTTNRHQLADTGPLYCAVRKFGFLVRCVQKELRCPLFWVIFNGSLTHVSDPFNYSDVCMRSCMFQAWPTSESEPH